MTLLLTVAGHFTKLI